MSNVSRYIIAGLVAAAVLFGIVQVAKSEEPAPAIPATCTGESPQDVMAIGISNGFTLVYYSDAIPSEDGQYTFHRQVWHYDGHVYLDVQFAGPPDVGIAETCYIGEQTVGSDAIHYANENLGWNIYVVPVPETPDDTEPDTVD